MKEKRDQLLQFVSDAEIVSIISHVAPDRDAIGSTLGLFWILKQKFPEKEIVMLNENDNRIKPGFIEGVEDIRVGETKRFLEKSDVVIILDQGSWKRVAPRIPEEILDDKKVIVIDHHLTKTDIRNDIYIHKIVPATGQLIFELFEGDFELVQRIAKPLLMAIFDDTGGFRYPGVDSETLRIAGMLLDTGLKIYEIAEEAKEIEQRIYEAGMKVVENVKFDSEKRYFATFISREDIEKFKLEYADIEIIRDAFMNPMLNIAQIDWGFMVKPKSEGKCGISFRSKAKTLNMKELAEKFEGGGHENAAGGSVDIADPKEAMEFIESKIFG